MNLDPVVMKPPFTKNLGAKNLSWEFLSIEAKKTQRLGLTHTCLAGDPLKTSVK
jgi:hypothetical protein